MSEAIVSEEAPVENGDNLSAEEIGAAFDALLPGDKLKLHAIETVFRGGTGFGPRDLIHESVCRALAGNRNCPRGIPFMAFVVETMRSVAHHDREKRHRTVPLSAVPRRRDEAEALPDRASEQLTPEEHLIEREAEDTVTSIHGQFGDDPEAQLVLMGWADGLRGKTLREATGLNQAALDYAGKRVRNRMRKLYPNGWTS
jgi:DNA-directed RNA polymerase specialized sigma24 family protein